MNKNTTITRLFIAAVLAPLTGCLWPMRLPVHAQCEYADNGMVTNCVRVSPLHGMGVKGPYPLLNIRLRKTPDLWRTLIVPIPSNLKGYDLARAKERKRLAPLGLIVMWIGLPIDLVVDTICLPFDCFGVDE